MTPEDERDIRDLIWVTLRSLLSFDVRTQDDKFIVSSYNGSIELPAADFHPDVINGAGSAKRFMSYAKKSIIEPLFGEQKNDSETEYADT